MRVCKSYKGDLGEGSPPPHPPQLARQGKAVQVEQTPTSKHNSGMITKIFLSEIERF